MSDSKPGLDFTALRVGLKWLVGSPIMISLGISQGVTGWIGESLWMRIIYPLILVPLGLLLGWLGYLLLVNEIFGLPKVSEDATEGPHNSLPGD